MLDIIKRSHKRIQAWLASQEPELSQAWLDARAAMDAAQNDSERVEALTEAIELTRQDLDHIRRVLTGEH